MHTPRPGVVQVELDMLFKEDEYQTMVDEYVTLSIVNIIFKF